VIQPGERLDNHHPSVQQITDWEILADQIPDAIFAYDLGDQIGLSVGRQSLVDVITELEDGLAPSSLIWKRMAAFKSLSHAEAESLQLKLKPYRQALGMAGWRLPANFGDEVIEYDDGFRIVATEQHIRGGDGEQLLKDPTAPDKRRWGLVEDVVLTLYNSYTHVNLPRQTIAGKELTALPCGYDLKPANVVLEAGSDRLYAIDVFGPKLLDKEGNWLAYSPKLDSLAQEKLRAVTATREGMLLRFWRLSEGFWQGGEQTLQERQDHFLALLPSFGAPQEEVAFITNEINQGYPWLDAIYSERLV
jgi:hypothetical protein